MSASPGAVAVVGGGRSLTYAALLERAAALAGYLRRAGVGPETIVGLCLPRGLDMVTAIVAVWQAGGAYLPLDPEYPAGRLEFMLADSRASVLVGHRDLVGALVAAGDLDAVVWPDDPEVAAAVAAGPPAGPPAVLAGQLAYVLYTSGSTGVPKGVQVSHGALVNYVARCPEAYPGVRGLTLLHAPFAFDGVVTPLYGALVSGGCVHVAALDEDLPLSLRQAGLGPYTFLKITPALLPLLTRLPGECSPTGELMVGGEAVHGGEVAEWRDRHPGAAVVDNYGPTETTVGCADYRIEPSEPVPGGVLPVGRPVWNMRLFVLDRWLNPVPAGVAGELWIGGAQVARGYGGRPALTAERFVADPFSGDGSRLYRSGDRVRWRADGVLEFLARADDQVKIRGFRVEPGEVEAALTAHPAIRAAVVVADAEGSTARLVAYLVPADLAEGIPPVTELREFLAGRLPAFMIPSVYTELTALPLTPNGKLDRAALPAPDRTRPDVASEFTAPATPAEDLLSGIWAQILGLDQIGARDNFFELGGHSLLATQVISRVRSVFGVDVPLAALFDHPTVAGLAGVIDDAATGAVAPPVTAAGRDRSLPLSFAQQRLWFLDQLEPGSTEYSLAMPVPLSGDLDVAALVAALTGVVARHEVLRTRLVADADGVAHQVIDRPAPFPLPVVDVSGTAGPAGAARALLAADAAAPFDLAAGPLIRACLIRLSTAHVLALAAHHVVTDEWSAGILRRELSALYGAARRGEPGRLPPLAVQYADFAVWQRAWLAGEVLEGQLAYWQERLAGAPVLDLPADRPRPPVRSSAGAYTAFTVPAQTAARLREVARDGGATMFMTVLAAFMALLARYCGQDDIVVGTPVANRNRAETEDLIGFFVNTLVMRADLSGDPEFTAVLARVREAALGAYAHQDLPFEQLVDALVTERDRSRTPLFQVLFNYGADDGRLSAGQDVRAGTAPDAGGAGVDALGLVDTRLRVTAKFDLRLVVAENNDVLAGVVEYSTALFDAATAERLAGHLGVLLAEAAADAGQRLSELPVLTPDERQQMLVAWNDTAAPRPAAGGVHELIAERVAAHPDAVAVVWAGRSLTYGALAQRANRMANHLRAVGAGTETVVGLCLPRGAEMVVAILAVWQAGGAYLPLDPEYPPARLAFMLADSRATVVAGPADVIDELPAGRARVIALDDPATAAALRAAPTAAPQVRVRPEQVAYVIYTSGSTGTPKGVQVTHGGLVNYVAGVPGRVGLGEPGGRYALLQPPVTDFGNTVIFTSMATGGVLHVADGGTVTDSVALAGYLARHDIEYLKVVPSHLTALAGGEEPGPLLPARTLVLGGEAASVGWVRRLLEAAGSRPVVNHYGPTETTIGVVTTPLSQGHLAGGVVPIGRPVANTRAFVLDRHLNPVPVGVAGELWIGGAQLARGYRGRPALTAERFVADPFAGDGARLYRTGDRVRWNAAGLLEFLGRGDDQVKVRGYRVEPGEVEAALAAHPRVRAAVVAVDGDGDRDDHGRRLVAYLVPADPSAGTPPVSELREFLGGRLPGFMIPAVFTELSALPLTTNGKLDRAALPAPDGARPDVAAFIAPSGEVEVLLAGVWAQVLGVSAVGAQDNFFELGGDSILSIQVVSRARALGVHLTPAQLFEHQTVAALAAVASREAPAEAEQGVVSGEFVLTPVQRWLLGRDLPQPWHFNQSMLLEASAPVDAAALRTAVAALVAQHDALRSRFARADREWAGRVAEAETADLVWEADAGAGPADADAGPADAGAGPADAGAGDRGGLEEQATAAQASLDLETGPLVRVVLFRSTARSAALAPGRELLLMVVHHLVVDTVSWPVLLEDLSAAYAQAEQGLTVTLPAKTTSFRRWAQRLAELAGSADLAAEVPYWERAVEQAGPVPRDHDGPNPVASAQAVRAVLAAGPTARLLREVPAAYQTQINDVLLTALGMVLTTWTQATRVVVDLEGHGREDAGPGIDVSRTVGWFTSVYPVVLQGAGVGGPGEALRRTKEHLRAVPRHGLGYGLLRYLAGAVPSSGGQVKFNYVGQAAHIANGPGQAEGGGPGQAAGGGPDPAAGGGPDPAEGGGPGQAAGGPRFRRAGWSAGRASSLEGERAYLLEINAQVVDDGSLVATWTYSSQVHDEATVARLARRYVEVLGELIEHCCSAGAGGYTPSDFPLAGLDQQALDELQQRFGDGS